MASMGKLEVFDKAGSRVNGDHRDGIYEDLDLMLKAARHALVEHATVRMEWHLRKAKFE